jgi:predicted nucleic acid-binding protein
LKCQTLDAETTTGNVPAEVREFVPNADVYLAEVFYAVSAEVIVTTDVGFYSAQDRSGGRIRIRMRDEFLAEYLRG